ncbi:hypothetical protein C1H46_041378 [Malus baccata]|uniref:Uncharacterized protein n=1 Tax=Malus baccata TaxID=106549 RepID=A0A540KFU5_MALBA|nr:hypothetical protein C1H46_041378 [Malus baccata]
MAVAACMTWVAVTACMPWAVSDTSDKEVADYSMYTDIQVHQKADFGVTVGFLVGMDMEEEADFGLIVGFPGYIVVAAEIFAEQLNQLIMFLQLAACLFKLKF